MPYTPTEWSRGDVVTSEKLNKLEQGVAAGGSFAPDINDPQDGDTLVYDASEQKWVNGSGGGSGGGVLVVNIANSNGAYICDKTASEIMSAAENGTVVFKSELETIGIVTISPLLRANYFENHGYTFTIYNIGDNIDYTADTGADYPQYIDTSG